MLREGDQLAGPLLARPGQCQVLVAVSSGLLRLGVPEVAELGVNLAIDLSRGAPEPSRDYGAPLPEGGFIRPAKLGQERVLEPF